MKTTEVKTRVGDSQLKAAGWSSHRHRTAIGRGDLSMPLRQCLRDAVIDGQSSVLDYGCGRGQDVKRLHHMGVAAVGWDPFFAPDTPLEQCDVVTLTYVLNVIEDPSERRVALARAWSLASRALAVTCRLKWEQGALNGREHGDGVVTSQETFQHLYTTNELRQLVEEVTGTRCISPAPGMVYAFRRNEDKLAYLARRTVPDFDWAQTTDYASALAEVVAFTEERGRVPIFEELPVELLPLLGSVPRSRLIQAVVKAAEAEKVASSTRRTTLDTLLYLGISIFNGRAHLSDLPLSIQADIKNCFQSYREACARADRLLAKIRDDTYLRGAMRNSPGKLTATALYVHERALQRMPVVLRLYEHCGYVAAGRPGKWNILKLDHRGRRVSWSHYPDFDTDPHPRLDSTYGVDMATLDASFQVFRDRTNRPLLHRKEEFLAPDDPDVPKYRRLTASEVRAGLYENPTQIGMEEGWSKELSRCGVQLKGHRVIRLNP
jgi:DNA phosphorothioation-associated putative methyltransferase